MKNLSTLPVSLRIKRIKRRTGIILAGLHGASKRFIKLETIEDIFNVEVTEDADN